MMKLSLKTQTQASLDFADLNDLKSHQLTVRCFQSTESTKLCSIGKLPILQSTGGFHQSVGSMQHGLQASIALSLLPSSFHLDAPLLLLQIMCRIHSCDRDVFLFDPEVLYYRFQQELQRKEIEVRSTRVSARSCRVLFFEK